MAHVEVIGLAELQRAAASLDPVLDASITKGLADSARLVAERAQVNAPKRSGRLAGSIEVFTEGATAGVRVTARRASRKYPSGYPYPLRIEQQRRFLARAITQEQDEVTRRMERVLDDVERAWGGA